MKLVIDRKKWLRGTGDGSLRNRKGEMCCLGFLAGACGINKGLTNIGMPSEVKAKKPIINKSIWGELLDVYDDFTCDSKLANRLAAINDSTKTSDSVKESKIIKNFKKIDVEVTFKN